MVIACVDRVDLRVDAISLSLKEEGKENVQNVTSWKIVITLLTVMFHVVIVLSSVKQKKNKNTLTKYQSYSSCRELVTEIAITTCK
jgi:hypothetical protein